MAIHHFEPQIRCFHSLDLLESTTHSFVSNDDWERHLCALIIIANTDAALRREAVSPEATEINVGLWHLGVGDEQPGPEDWLGEDVKDGIGNDLLVDIEDTGSVSDSPDAAMMSGLFKRPDSLEDSHWIGSPEEESVSRDGSKELANVAALAESHSTSVDDQVPNDDKVSDAGNGIPAPLLCTAVAVSSEETSKNHDQISNNSHEHVATVEASEEHKIEEEKRSGDGPVNITSPVDLAVDVVVSGWNAFLVVLCGVGVLPRDTVLGGHTIVRYGSGDGDESSDDMVKAAGL
jgi:hypothetical protein